uniref:Protein kinase domain-containing protein n=1 Tax=Parastrongyloides trichosuri TaxID=131310 RepID=A0A0N4ZWB2_PARTI
MNINLNLPFQVDTDIVLTEILKNGGFATIFKGLRKNMLVAVKGKHMYNKTSINEVKHMSLFIDSKINALPSFINCILNSEKNIRFIIMEYYEKSVFDHVSLRSSKILTFNEVLDMSYDILDAMMFLNSFQIIHADLKESNVIMKKQEIGPDSVCLIDFGSSKTFGEKNESTANVTLPYVGLWFHKDHAINYSSDLFSLTVMLIKLLKINNF